MLFVGFPELFELMVTAPSTNRVLNEKMFWQTFCLKMTVYVTDIDVDVRQ